METKWILIDAFVKRKGILYGIVEVINPAKITTSHRKVNIDKVGNYVIIHGEKCHFHMPMNLIVTYTDKYSGDEYLAETIHGKTFTIK